MIYRLLQLFGVFLCLIALIHLYNAPLVGLWLKNQLSSNFLKDVGFDFLLNQLIGILIIPFGISTVYCAAGVKEGRKWAKMIALINAIVLIILPLMIFILNGFQYTSNYFLLITDVLMLIIGVTMFILLLWL